MNTHCGELIRTQVLVVDDEEDMLEICRKILALRPVSVDISTGVFEALRLYQERRHDLVIVDLRMPEMSGLEFMKRIHQIEPEQLVLLITAFASAEIAISAIRSGAFDFIRKPFKKDELLVVVDRALRLKTFQNESFRLQKRPSEDFISDKIVGKSAALRESLIRLQKVSQVDVPVLVHGESGTGKELFARTIHGNSGRRAKPFVAIDCASLPEQLLESELFGYERGAFTGAIQAKMGLFEVGSGGTVLLDEVGEMPLALQAKFLRVLQEGTVRRLGSGQERNIDVRVVSATHRDLDTMISEGTFREDLYYRLNLVTIEVPPLRERLVDIPILAKHFFDSFRSKVAKNVEGISAAVLLILEEYDWPGNVRELQNVIERACTLTDSSQIIPQDLPAHILSVAEEGPSHAKNGDFQHAKRMVLQEFEHTYLSKALVQTRGNVTDAAHLSGMSRPAFHRLMAKYGISSSSFKEE